MLIHNHGAIQVPLSVTGYACNVRFEAKRIEREFFPKKHPVNLQDIFWLDRQLGKRVPQIIGRGLDVVIFSCCEGADEHVDKLPKDKFEDTTFLIPLVLPRYTSFLISRDPVASAVDMEPLLLNTLYEFDHTLPHELSVEDRRGGCVVMMIAIKK